MGVLGHVKESVTIVNRYNKPISCRYDGEDITIPPGPLPGFPKVAVPFAIKQNPVMGSRHPIDPRKFHSLVGVEGSRHYPCTPLTKEQIERHENSLELVDRDGEIWGEPMEKRKLLRKNKKYSNYEAAVAVPAEFDVNRKIE